MGDSIKFTVVAADSFRKALNEAGWAGRDVEAACIVRQGEAPSMASTMIGVGVLKLLKRRGVKELPRKFVLAVTADSVVAFEVDSHSRGKGSPSDDEFVVTIKPEQHGSWPRDQVSMVPSKDGITSNAVLTLAGAEMPCAVPNSDAEAAWAELEAALAPG